MNSNDTKSSKVYQHFFFARFGLGFALIFKYLSGTLVARPLLEMFSSSNELYQFEGGKQMAMAVFCKMLSFSL